MKTLVAAIGGLLALFLNIQPALATDGAPTWSFSDVGSPPAQSYVSTPALAFDHYGTPSVTWSTVSTAGGSNNVFHSRLLGLGLWYHATMAGGIGLGLRTAVSYDRAERPVVAWINGDGTVKASFDDGPTQNVGTSAAINNPVLSLTHDLVGTLHGAFASTTAGNLWSISQAGGIFSSADMLSLNGVSSVYDAQLAVDARGLRQIAARAALSGGGEAVMIASEAPGGIGWASAALASDNSVKGVDIAIDPTDGLAALAYTTLDAGGVSRLYYSKFTGSLMQTSELLTSSTFRYDDVSLAFDRSDGRPAVAYERKNLGNSNEELFYGFLDATLNWQHGLVDGSIKMDAPAGKPRGPSLAFDDYGTSWPAIAYIDADDSLNVAFDPPAPEPTTAALLIPFVISLRGRRRRSQPGSGFRSEPPIPS